MDRLSFRPRLIDELFREVDTDRSGQIDKEEFLDFIKKANAEAS